MHLSTSIPAILLIGLNLAFAELIWRTCPPGKHLATLLVMTLSGSMGAGILAAALYGNAAVMRSLGLISIVFIVTLAQMNRMLHFRWWAPIQFSARATRWTMTTALVIVLLAIAMLTLMSTLSKKNPKFPGPINRNCLCVIFSANQVNCG